MLATERKVRKIASSLGLSQQLKDGGIYELLGGGEGGRGRGGINNIILVDLENSYLCTR